MPKAAPPTRLAFTTYQHLLDVLVDNAMTVVRRVSEELSPTEEEAAPRMDFSTVARNFAVITALVRRAVMVSRYLENLPVPREEREQRLGPALDRVFDLFALRKITVEQYNRAIDAEIDGDLDDELDDDLFEDDEFEREERESSPHADFLGRPPCALVAELCRDFGMIAHSMPPEWLEPVPTELRLLCARAAAAAIRPSGPTRRENRSRPS